MNRIVLKDVSKSFGENKVLDKFCAEIPYGARLCIMAPSGEGKTTLLNLILGLITVDSGEISGVPKNLSAVFQEDRLCESFTAVGNILAVCGDKKSINEINECLSLLGLEESINQKVSELSGGMKRRVAIARALMADGDLVVFDEPFKGLDDAMHKQTADVIMKYTKGKTLILSTHDSLDSQLLNAEILYI